MTFMVKDGKVLSVGGLVASDPDCCCIPPVLRCEPIAECETTTSVITQLTVVSSFANTQTFWSRTGSGTFTDPYVTKKTVYTGLSVFDGTYIFTRPYPGCEWIESPFLEDIAVDVTTWTGSTEHDGSGCPVGAGTTVPGTISVQSPYFVTHPTDMSHPTPPYSYVWSIILDQFTAGHQSFLYPPDPYSPCESQSLSGTQQSGNPFCGGGTSSAGSATVTPSY